MVYWLTSLPVNGLPADSLLANNPLHQRENTSLPANYPLYQRPYQLSILSKGKNTSLPAVHLSPKYKVYRLSYLVGKYTPTSYPT
jgi:hypothetical protein